MREAIHKLQIFFITLGLLAVPTFVQAVATGSPSPGLRFDLISPIQFVSIEGLITGILNILLVIAVPIIIFFIIFAGFSYVTAQGNPEKIKTASRSLTYGLIGAVLILGGVALAEIIKNIVTSFGTT